MTSENTVIDLYDCSGAKVGEMVVPADLDRFGPRMDMYSKPGTRVVFAYPEAGYNPDIERAAKHLTLGETYTVEITDVHSWHTDVFLEEFPGIPFNHVMFVREDLYVSSPNSSSESNE